MNIVIQTKDEQLHTLYSGIARAPSHCILTPSPFTLKQGTFTL